MKNMNYNNYMNYNELPNDTKMYLNKAMQIFDTIRNKDIVQNIKKSKYSDEVQYSFSMGDKFILSLFMSGFYVNGYIKDILNNQKDIKKEDFLSFIKINEFDIQRNNVDFETYYNKYFMKPITALASKAHIYIAQDLVPSNIYLMIKNNNPILEYYALKYNVINDNCLKFFLHPIFNEVYIKGEDLEYEEKINSMKKHHFSEIPGIFKLVTNQPVSIKTQIINQPSSIKTTEAEKELVDVNNKEVFSLINTIQSKYIGQEDFTSKLFYNIIYHQRKVQQTDYPYNQRSVIFVDGPSGTGKTAITKEISEQLGIPFSYSSSTNYSAEGYKGGDVVDILKDLYLKSKRNLELAQRGIVILDEIDKLAGEKALEMSKSVQQQLLVLLGGGKYSFEMPSSNNEFERVEFDTSKLTFVCLGALTDLRKKKTQKKSVIGFNSNNNTEEIQEYTITQDDLDDYGFESELSGRFNVFLHTDDYSKDDLKKILMESDISPLADFKRDIILNKKELRIEGNIYDIIAEQAYKLNKGARSLDTVINSIKTHFLGDILNSDQQVIVLNEEILNKIFKEVETRKARN